MLVRACGIRDVTWKSSKREGEREREREEKQKEDCFPRRPEYSVKKNKKNLARIL